MQTAYERRDALFAKLTGPALIAALIAADKVCDGADAGPEHRLTRAWLIEETERRYPAAAKAVEDAFMAAELSEIDTGVPVTVDYVAVLVAAVAR